MFNSFVTVIVGKFISLLREDFLCLQPISIIDLLFYLGLISSDFHKALHLVRKIRNDAAHDHYPFLLDSEAQRDRVDELRVLLSTSFGFDEFSQILNCQNSKIKRGFFVVQC